MESNDATHHVSHTESPGGNKPEVSAAQAWDGWD